MSFDRVNLAKVGAAAVATVTAVQGVTATVALRSGRRDYADGAWGIGLGAVAGVAAAIGRGDRARRVTTAVLVGAWATRLTRQMSHRFSGSETEDERYTAYLEGEGTGAVLRKVFLTQGLAQLVVSAPVQLAGASPLPRGPRRLLFPAGVAIAITGAAIEATADAQKDAYRNLPDERRPDILDTGLWGWSRHPNYFGDSLFWDGIWVIAAASAPGALTVFAPAAMTYFLVFATGAKRTEARMQERPGYRDYQQRVSFFVPLPPSR